MTENIYLSVTQLARRYSVDRSTIWRWVQDGILPQPFRISDQCTRWRLDEIEKRDAEREIATASPRVLQATKASLQKRQSVAV